MIIYVDIVFVENLLMNYIILFATAIINKVEIRIRKIFLASLLGSLYAIVIQFVVFQNFIGIVIKIILSITMVYIAFKPGNFKKLFRQILIFYLTSFTLGGVAFFLLYFVRPQDILIKNGVYIGTYPIKIALLGGTIGFAIITIAFKIIKSNINKQNILYELEICLNGKDTTMTALLDTGNLLKEPISGTPVAIVEKSQLEKILPMNFLNNIEKIMNGNIGEVESYNQYINRLRMIPFASIGKQDGMLLGIKADYATLKYNEEKSFIKEIILGIYEGSLSKSNKYHALIGLDILEGRGVKNEYTRNVKV